MTEPSADTAPREDNQWQRPVRRIFAANVLTVIGFGIASPFVPLFLQELTGFDARRAAVWTGIAASLNGLLMFLAAPLWGVLSDWFGHKRNALRACVGTMAVLIGGGLSQTLGQFLTTRVAMGVASGVTPALMGLMATVVPRRKLALNVGIFQACAYLGATIGPLIGGIVAAAYGYRVGFIASGIVMGLAGMVVLLGVRVRFQPSGNMPRSVGGLKQELGAMLAVPGVRGALLVLCLVQMAPNIVMPVTPLLLKTLTPGTGPLEVGVFYAVTGLSSGVACLATGLLVARLGMRPLLFAGCAAGLCGALIIAAAGSAWMAISVSVLLGAGVGVLSTTAATLVGSLAPPNRQGSAFGVVQSANAVGFGIGPLIGGFVGGAAGLRAPFLAEAAMFLVVAFVVWRQSRSPALRQPVAA